MAMLSARTAHRCSRRGDLDLYRPRSTGQPSRDLKMRRHCSDTSLWTSLPSVSGTTLGPGRPNVGPQSTCGGAKLWPRWRSPRWSELGPTRRPTTPWSSSTGRRHWRPPQHLTPPSRRCWRRHHSCAQTPDGTDAAACHCRKVSTKREPPWSVSGDSARTVPPIATASSATIASPNPEPIRRFGPRSAR
jgi:hypothetical protein